MLSIVKQFIRKEVENKRVGLQVVDDTFNTTIGGDAYSLLPPIAEGTAGNERIGDKVRPKLLTIRGSVQWDGNYVSHNACPPATLRLLILSQKNIKIGGSASPMTTPDLAHLLKDNVGTDVARQYTGGPWDNHAPINTELFKVYMDRKVSFNAAYTASVPAVGVWAGTNGTYHFKVTIKCPATLSFDDGNGNYANNFAPFFCMAGTWDDGSTTNATFTPWRVRVLSVLDYEDA